VFQPFRGMGIKDVWGPYQDHVHPRAMMFVPLRGMSTPDTYRHHLDLSTVFMSPYVEYRDICSFEHVNLYSGWLGYCTRKLRYLPDQVLRQFGLIFGSTIHVSNTLQDTTSLRKPLLSEQDIYSGIKMHSHVEQGRTQTFDIGVTKISKKLYILTK